MPRNEKITQGGTYNLQYFTRLLIKPSIHWSWIGYKSNALPFFLHDLGCITLVYPKYSKAVETMQVTLNVPPETIKAHLQKFDKLSWAQQKTYITLTKNFWDNLLHGRLELIPINITKTKGIKLWFHLITNSKLEYLLALALICALVFVFKNPEILPCSLQWDRCY